MSVALTVYHKLPPFSQTIVASARGYYLGWWRYGKESERLIGEALDRDSWSDGEWSKWQSERLSYLLQRAATKVPYYREMWQERRRNGDTASWEYLENWPILEKKDVRLAARDFVTDDRSIAKMFHDHTSGTTGTSLDLWLTSDTVKQWYALFEARSRRWYGLSRHDRWAILGGQLVTPAKQKKPPFWVWNAGLNQLYLSSYHLSPELIPSYLNAINKYKVRYILGYPSALYELALGAIRNRSDLKLDVVITNAEPLFDYQRQVIESAFSCPVRETYGMAEIVAAASECQSGKMHVWPDTGIIEIDKSASVNEDAGDLICTGLINSDMPLIRYRVGDSGGLSDNTCSCGKSLPLLGKIDGRSDDLLITADGKRIGRLDPIFKSNLGILEAQIVQNSLNSILLRYVPASDFNVRSLATLTSRLLQRLGNVEVSYEALTEIPRTSRGKFRSVICNVSEDEISAAGLA